MHKVKIAIVGASGYSGAEALKILMRHGHAEVVSVIARSNVGKRVSDVYPELCWRVDLDFQAYSTDALGDADAVLVALPSGETFPLIREMLKTGKKIIDFGGDFRLSDVSLYKAFYGREHTAEDLIGKFIYGMTELNRAKIREATLVSNPGCYPTSAIIPLAPFVKKGFIETKGIVINSMSGVSGAGRGASPETSFCEVNENVRAYKVGRHQHKPEIEQALEMFGGEKSSVVFVPHLIPITRGIYTTIQARLKKNISEDAAYNVLSEAYEGEPFIRVLKNAFSETRPELRRVQYTNNVEVGYAIDTETKTLTLLSAIDNLVKGAAGQAIQNMNVMNGLTETEGLL